MAFSLDSSSRKLIDFFYNRAELVSRASFAEDLSALHLENRPACQGAAQKDRIKRLQPFLSADSVMDTDLAGRLAKLKDIKSYKEPLLEAVANSIQAIQQTGRKDGHIEVFIEWLDESKSDIVAANGGERPYRKIQNIVIRDNGPGFTEANFQSFLKLDSQYKADEFGCLGVGRLLWLKVFSTVEVNSVYSEGGKKFQRSFHFSAEKEVSEIVKREVEDGKSISTEIKLKNIRWGFQNKRTVNLDDIAETIFRHFLLLYVMETVPKITVHDNEETREVLTYYQRAYNGEKPDKSSFRICGHDFSLIQQKLNTRPTEKLPTAVYFCAGQRVVSPCKGIDPRVCNALGAKNGADEPFMYVGLLQGDYLDANVSSTRKQIIFPTVTPEGEDDGLPFEPIESQLLEKVNELVRDYLKSEFEVLTAGSNARLQQFVDDEAPEFKGFVNEFRDELFVTPNESNHNVYEYLHRRFFESERVQSKKVNDLISVDWSGQDAEEKIEEIERRMAPYASHDLVRFAAKRKFYLEMLRKATQLKDDGKYQREAAVHSLIFPMQSDTAGSEGMTKQNLWLIDDRLAFSHYIASDKRFSAIPITDSESIQRMDLAALKLYAVGDSTRPGELSIIEFKRPGRNDYDSDENPISQVLDYVEELKNGKITAADGTEISNAKNLPIFCYVIAQFTEKLRRQCRNSNLAHNEISDFYFGTVQNVYFELMNFNSLFRKAHDRNHALLVAAGLEQLPA
nr:MAG TPA: Mismatch repair endonuclease PMS2 [Caudoviricetes sp.]